MEIAKLRAILGDKGDKLSDIEILQIVDFLKAIASIVIEGRPVKRDT